MFYKHNLDEEIDAHSTRITTVEHSLQNISMDVQLLTKDVGYNKSTLEEMDSTLKDIHGLVYQINDRLIKIETLQARIPWMPRIIEKNMKLIISILFGLILLLVQSLIYLK